MFMYHCMSQAVSLSRARFIVFTTYHYGIELERSTRSRLEDGTQKTEMRTVHHREDLRRVCGRTCDVGMARQFRVESLERHLFTECLSMVVESVCLSFDTRKPQMNRFASSDWGDTVTIDGKGVKQLKHAVQCAETIAGSLDTFLGCVRKRLEDLQDCLRSTATKTYFPLLSDDILAIIFELASLPSTGVAHGEFDSKTPSKISQVSRRFRNVALKLPHLWRFIDARSQSWSDVQLLASRSAVAGEILEVLMESSIVDPGRRVEELYSFFGHVSSLSSRITRSPLRTLPGGGRGVTFQVPRAWGSTVLCHFLPSMSSF